MASALACAISEMSWQKYFFLKGRKIAAAGR
jgi:hypothetical protein